MANATSTSDARTYLVAGGTLRTAFPTVKVVGKTAVSRRIGELTRSGATEIVVAAERKDGRVDVVRYTRSRSFAPFASRVSVESAPQGKPWTAVARLSALA